MKLETSCNSSCLFVLLKGIVHMKYLLDTANLDKIRELCQHASAAYSGDGMMGDCITPCFNRILGSCFLQILEKMK